VSAVSSIRPPFVFSSDPKHGHGSVATAAAGYAHSGLIDESIRLSSAVFLFCVALAVGSGVDVEESSSWNRDIRKDISEMTVVEDEMRLGGCLVGLRSQKAGCKSTCHQTWCYDWPSLVHRDFFQARRDRSAMFTGGSGLLRSSGLFDRSLGERLSFVRQ
jgi:hypothetical protein